MPRKENPETRSRIMASIKSRGTVIEIIVREIIEGTGISFEEHPKGMFGNPDFIVPSRRVAIFCDGDFWHGFRMRSNPRLNVKENREFWQRKIRANVRRDREVDRLLRKDGWKVLRFWEHDIKGDPDRVREKLRGELSE